MKTLKSRTLSCSQQRVLLPSMAHVNAACRKDFVSFVRKSFHVLNPSARFDMNWHICAIAHYLEQVRLGNDQTADHHPAAAYPQINHVFGRVPGFCSGPRSEQALDRGQLQCRSGDQTWQ